VNIHFEYPPEYPASLKTKKNQKKKKKKKKRGGVPPPPPTPDHSKAVFIAFLAAYYSSDTFPLRPQEMSVDCFIIAFLVHTVPLPDNPA